MIFWNYSFFIIINLDFIFDGNDDVWIIELGPRNGGNLITDAIRLANGVDLAEYTVRAALGEDISDLKDKQMTRFIASYIWHSTKNGRYRDIHISQQLYKQILQSDMFIKKGDEVFRFDNGGYGLGAALIEFEEQNQMVKMMDAMDQYYTICLS